MSEENTPMSEANTPMSEEATPMSEEKSKPTSVCRDGVWYDAAGKVYTNQERAKDPSYRRFVDAFINGADDEERHLPEPNVPLECYPNVSTVHLRGRS